MRFRKTRLLNLLAIGSFTVAYSAVLTCSSFAANGDGGIIIERVSGKKSGSIKDIIGLLEREQAANIPLRHAKGLQLFYIERDFEPFWIDGDRLNDEGEFLLRELQNAWTHGLNPNQYRVNILKNLSEKRGDKDAMRSFEVLMSDAYVSYVHDITGIRVDPKFMRSEGRYWKHAAPDQDALSALQGDGVEDALTSFIPKGATYTALRDELIKLYKNFDDDQKKYGRSFIALNGSLSLYDESEAVPKIRARLGVDADDYAGAHANVYDQKLQEAVVAFQMENGLVADGIIGQQTVDSLNRSPMDKIYQIIANLERLRWVNENKPDKFVLVNIPSAMLWAVEDGRVAFDMPVIVGRTKRETNIFITDITGVRLNPTWTVPPTIKKEDILPKLIEDPGYLADKGMDLVYGSGEEQVTLDPLMINWSEMTGADLSRMRMVQTPGAHNPLGAVRVLMPNGYNIYLHDTNEKHYFNRSSRAISSGCIRMKDPLRMADFILSGKKGWDRQRIEQVIAEGKLRDIYIQDTIPVYLVYQTAWLDADDHVILGRDIYNYDRILITELAKLDQIMIPVQSGN